MQRVKRSTAAVALPSPPGGGTPGFFAQPNPGGGIAATVPGYEWFNNVQEELCAVILAAGLTLDVNNAAQLLAALRTSGVFQTASQFDNSTKAATTAWIRNLGNIYAGIKSVSGVATLDTTYAGQLTVFSATSYTATLPAASTFPAGITLNFFSVASGTVTLARAGSDTIVTNAGTPATSLGLLGGDTLTLVSNGVNAWEAVGGSAQLPYAPEFGSSFGANGWQKLPSGLIVQWGVYSFAASSSTTATFPLAFPTGPLQIFPAPPNNNNMVCNTTSTPTTATFSTASAQTFNGPYLAIGR